MAFRYYDAEKVINGKKMKDWLKFAMAWWHTLCAEGGDQFGGGTKKFPWNGDADKVQAAKIRWMPALNSCRNGNRILLFPWCGLVCQADTIEEYEANLKRDSCLCQTETGWNRNQIVMGYGKCFGHARYMNRAATNPEFDDGCPTLLSR